MIGHESVRRSASVNKCGVDCGKDVCRVGSAHAGRPPDGSEASASLHADTKGTAGAASEPPTVSFSASESAALAAASAATFAASATLAASARLR